MPRLLIPFTRTVLVVCVILVVMVAGAQQPPPQEKKPESPLLADKLVTAKSVFLRRATGSTIPFDVISSGLEGWGRFTVVDTADKADLVLEVSGPADEPDVRTTTSTKDSPTTHRPEQSTSTSREMSSLPVRLAVYDGKSKVMLWMANAGVKFALKEKARENNIVEAAQRVFARFHDRVEPPAKQ